jgi:hypothetical protein
MDAFFVSPPSRRRIIRASASSPAAIRCWRTSAPASAKTCWSLPAAADAARPSVVAKAERSEAAQRKARNRCTDDGLPVHSFRSLLGDLATVTRNVMAMDGAPEASFVLYPQLTLVQDRAFQLLDLGVKV